MWSCVWIGREVRKQIPMSSCVCIVRDQWPVIKFVWLEDIKPGEIHRRVLQQYGDAYLDDRRKHDLMMCLEIGEHEASYAEPSERTCLLAFFSSMVLYTLKRLLLLLTPFGDWYFKSYKIVSYTLTLLPLIINCLGKWTSQQPASVHYGYKISHHM